MKTLKDMTEAKKDTEKTDSLQSNKIKYAEKGKVMSSYTYLKEDDIKWTIAFFILILLQEHENEKLWKDFKEEIKFKSHFFPKSELLKKIDNISDYAAVKLSVGTILYRAREYREVDYLKNEEVIAIYEKLNELFPDLELQLEDITKEAAMNIISLIFCANEKKLELLQQMVKEIEDIKKPFWGFDEKNCDAPPKECAKAGRANSVGISFLYAATDIKTAIMEMRPQIGQCFNISKIEICRDIRIFDFTYVSNELKEDEYDRAGDLYVISKEFSTPNFGNIEEYIPTQYLCEYLREQGFDGIRFKSAVSSNGINLIIFDIDKVSRAYKIVESRVYNVANMDIDYEQMLPIEIENID